MIPLVRFICKVVNICTDRKSGYQWFYMAVRTDCFDHIRTLIMPILLF